MGLGLVQLLVFYLSQLVQLLSFICAVLAKFFIFCGNTDFLTSIKEHCNWVLGSFFDLGFWISQMGFFEFFGNFPSGLSEFVLMVIRIGVNFTGY